MKGSTLSVKNKMTSDDDEDIISVDRVCEDCLPEYKRTYIIPEREEEK